MYLGRRPLRDTTTIFSMDQLLLRLTISTHLMKQGSRSWLKTAGTVLVVTTNPIGAKRNVPVVLKEGDVLKISSILFKESPVYHEIPPIYEGLGLPDLSSFIEQPFEFVYTMGKVDRLGHGSIRFYKQQGDFKVTISDDLPGVGPTRLVK